MNKKGIVLFSAILLIMSCNSKNDNCKNKNVQSNQKQVNEYFNPIIQGFYPDPSICSVGEDYYMAHSSFEYFPGVPIFHSKDLIHWEQIGHALTRKSQLNFDTVPASRGIYASTLRFHNDTFYMITTSTIHGGNFVVHTADPYGEWSVPVWIDMPGIDPSLFWDDDGKVFHRHGIVIFLFTGNMIYSIRKWGMSGRTCYQKY